MTLASERAAQELEALRPILLGYVRRHYARNPLFEDLEQEASLGAWQRLVACDHPNRIAVALNGARTRIANFLRNEQRHERRRSDYLLEDLQETAVVPDFSPDILERQAARETWREVWKQAGIRQRQYLGLMFGEGLTAWQVAERQGVSISTVTATVREALDAYRSSHGLPLRPRRAGRPVGSRSGDFARREAMRAAPRRSAQKATRAAGELLQNRRRGAGLSLTAVARAVGVTRFSVAHWEHGEAIPTDEHLARLAELLDFSSAGYGALLSAGAAPAPRPVRALCSAGHPLTGDNTYVDRGGSSRCCLCRTEAVRRWRARKKEARR